MDRVGFAVVTALWCGAASAFLAALPALVLANPVGLALSTASDPTDIPGTAFYVLVIVLLAFVQAQFWYPVGFLGGVTLAVAVVLAARRWAGAGTPVSSRRLVLVAAAATGVMTVIVGSVFFRQLPGVTEFIAVPPAMALGALVQFLAVQRERREVARSHPDLLPTAAS